MRIVRERSDSDGLQWRGACFFIDGVWAERFVPVALSGRTLPWSHLSPSPTYQLASAVACRRQREESGVVDTHARSLRQLARTAVKDMMRSKDLGNCHCIPILPNCERYGGELKPNISTPLQLLPERDSQTVVALSL
jgi:hypothetical protein